MYDVISSTGRPKIFSEKVPTGASLGLTPGVSFAIGPDFNKVQEGQLHILWVQPFTLKSIAQGEIRVVTHKEEKGIATTLFEVPAGMVTVNQRVDFWHQGATTHDFFESPPAIEVVVKIKNVTDAERLRVRMRYKQVAQYIGEIAEIKETNEPLWGYSVHISRWVSEVTGSAVIVYLPEDEKIFKDLIFRMELGDFTVI